MNAKIFILIIILSFSVLFFGIDFSEELDLDFSQDIYQEIENNKQETPKFLHPYKDLLISQNYGALIDSLKAFETDIAEKDFLIGYSYFRISLLDSAESYFLRTVDEKFGLFQHSLYFLEQIYLQKEDYAKAIKNINYLLFVSPESYWTEKIWIDLAYAYYELEDYSSAATSYMQYQKKYPNGKYEFTAKQGYADCLRKLGVTEEAEKLEKYLWITYPHLYKGNIPKKSTHKERYNRIENLYKYGLYKTTIKACDFLLGQKGLAKNITNHTMLYKAKAMRMLTIKRRGRRWRRFRIRTRKRAIADLKRLIMQTENKDMLSEAYYYIAKLYQESLKEKDFEKWAINGLKTYPKANYADKTLYALIEFYQDTNQEDKILEYITVYADSFLQSPFADDFLWVRGQIYYRKKIYREAAFAFSRLSKISSDNETKAKALYWEAKALEKLNKTDFAIKKYSECRANYISYYAYLSENRLWELGEVPPAQLRQLSHKSSFERGNLSKDTQIHLQWADDFVRLGLYDSAKMEFDYLIEKFPNEPFYRSQLAWLYFEQAKYGDAILVLNEGLNKGLSYPSQVWQMCFPRIHYGKVLNHSVKNRVDPLLVMAMIRQESLFNPNAKSWMGARGLMQIMPRTGYQLARQMGLKPYKRNRLYEIDVNLDLGTYYLKTLLDTFDGDLILAISSYNGGIGNVYKWLKEHPNVDTECIVETFHLDETKSYTKIVLTNFWIYQRLYRFGFTI